MYREHYFVNYDEQEISKINLEDLEEEEEQEEEILDEKEEDEEEEQISEGDDISFQELISDAGSTKVITPNEVLNEVLIEVKNSSLYRGTKTTVEDLKEKLNTPLSEIFPDSNYLLEVVVNLEFRIRLRRFFDLEELKGLSCLQDIVDLMSTLV